MYATTDDVQKGFRVLDSDDLERCEALINEAGRIIDALNSVATDDVKNLVVCQMVRRALSAGDVADIPMGASQGSMSALGYTQSWTISSGSTGELYLTKLEKKMLGVSNRIDSHSPLEEL